MKKIIYIALVATGLTLSACNDSFMERYSDTSLTENTVFGNYNTFKTYAWGLYEVFTNGNILRRIGSDGAYASSRSYFGDVYAGYLMERQGGGNPYAFQNISSVASGNGWSFGYIRSVNVMLANIDKSAMSDVEKEHWRSVGYFFRAYFYAELIARFGDVPWVDHTLAEDDTEIALGKRTPRKTVADNVLKDLIYAEEHIKPDGDGDNTINTNVVRALISRFSLFEGTWRKYHNLGDYDRYFDVCVEYSGRLMTAVPDLHTDWGEMLTSNLAGMKGILLYKEYVPSEENNYAMHLVERTSTHNIEMPQHIIDMYLCSDGKPVSTSGKYEWGKTDKTMYSTFRNRDRRLLETVAPPYQVVNHGNTSWDYVDGKREYMDLLGVTRMTGYGGGNGEAGKHKVFPMMNWAGNILHVVPHFFTNQDGVGFCVAKSGNYVWRLYNVWDSSLENKADADMPIFKIDEVLLNYAEAKYEKGEFDNNVADMTINKLRRQFAKIADMDVDAINSSFDPNRDPDVDPVLWEIRRERMVELMGEGFGFYDVRRWKKAEWFVNKVAYGQWATKEQIGESGTFIDLNTGLATTDKEQKEGYIYMYNDPVKAGKGWLDKYYLYQIPTNEIALNPNLLPNNPGW